MIFDDADAYIVLFGGVTGSGASFSFLSDTWKFQSGVWTNITNSNHPSPRGLASITYDTLDGYVILFGGGAGSFNIFPTVSLHDTWKFLSGVWTNITTTNSPPARFGSSMIYDTQDQYPLLFGGGEAGVGLLRDSWKFAGGLWTNVTSSIAPPPRIGAAMAYDLADHYSVLFGGLSGSSSTDFFVRDTWEYSAGVWTNITQSTGPSAREGASMALDVADNHVLLFGGASSGGIYQDTWKFTASSWTNITSSSGPSRLFFGSMAYDPLDPGLVLFGGSSGTNSLGTAWTFLSGVWTAYPARPSPRLGAPMAYDAADGYVVLFGGAENTSLNTKNFDDTWKFQAGVWTNITASAGTPPTAIGYSPMAYDASDGYVLLTQGFVSWAFKAGVWSVLSTSCSTGGACPPGRNAAAIIYDAADGYVVLFGGCCKFPGLTGLDDTWEYHGGTWTNITTSNGPSPRLFPSMAYDAADRYGVLFGGLPVLPQAFPFSTFGDTWKFAGGSWTNITTTSGPPGRAVATMDYDAVAGFTVLFGGVNSATGQLGDTWKFVGGVWTSIVTITSASPRSNAAMVYDAADTYLVLFGGTYAGAVLSDTWAFSASAPAFDYLLSNNGPVNIVAGSSGTVTITTSLTSGTTQPVTPSCVTPLPTGITCTSFSPPSVTPSSTGATTTLTINVASSATVGPHNLQVTGSPLGATTTATAFSVTVSTSGPWTNITQTTGPSQRVGGSMVYDAADGYVVLFGGLSTTTGFTPLRDTWKFLAGSWTNITTSSGPSPRYASSMVYDTADGYVILFGGWNGNPATGLGDTWKFHGGAWTNISSSNGPSPRISASMAYDAADGYVILFGGATAASSALVTHDTWKFLGGSWTNITSSTGPSARFEASMVYDAADGYAVLVGGFGVSGVLGDTWKIVGGSWTNITSSTGPSARSVASIAYDVADGYVVLFGGSSISGDMGDTWKFLASSWTNITSSTGPSARFEASMVYDAADNYVVLFGGDSATALFGDTWKYSSRANPAFDYSLSNNGPLSITSGGSASVSITTTLKAGTGQPVTLSCSGLPSGITCGSFTNNPVDPSSSGATSSLSINVASSVAAGPYTFQVAGNPVGATTSAATTTINLTVTSSKDGTSTAISTINCYFVQGGTSCSVLVLATVVDTTNPSNAPSGTVTFTLTAGTTGGSLGSTCELTSYQGVGGCAVTFTGTTSGSGSVTATYGGDATHSPSTSTPAVVTVIILPAKDNTSTTIQGTLNCSIGLGQAGCLVTVNVTVTDTTNPLNIPGSNCNITGCVVAFTLDPGTTGGAIFHSCLLFWKTGSCYQVFSGATPGTATITATYGGDMSHNGSTSPSSTITVTVSAPVDYTLSTSGPATVQAGSSGSVSVTATLVSGSREPVTLACLSSSLPAGASCSFNPQLVTPSTSGVTSVLTVQTSSSTPTGSFQVQVVGSPLGASTIAAKFTLTVTAPPQLFDYTLSVNPTSASIVQGSATSAIVTATLTSGTGQQVQLIVGSITPNPVVCQSNTSPCGSLTFAPASITPTAQGATSTMTIMTSAILPPGTYTVTIHGSPAGQSSSTATFTVTVAAPSTSTVSCGHNESCGVVSNATLSNVKIAGNTLHIEADGTQGAHGYANVTVPKSEIPNIDEMHVFVDNNKLNSGVTITSNSTAYFIYFTFTFHSPVKIDIQLSAPQQTPNAPTILGIDQTLFYEIIGGIIAAIVIVSAVVVVARRRKTIPPS
jgi:hypothetical protein